MKHKDDKFIEQLNRKNISAYKEFYRRYYRALVAYVMSFVERQEIAEDIVQELIVSIWEKNYTFNDEQGLRYYLYTALRNKSINHLDHIGVERKYHSYISKQASSSLVDEELFQEDVFRRLYELISELPARQKEIFLLYMEGRRNEEIATALGISVETVKTHRKRAIESIRKKMAAFAFFLAFLPN